MKKTLSSRPSPDRKPVAFSQPVAGDTKSSKPAGAPKFTPRGSAKERVLVAVTDGKIDFSAMSPEATKMLNELLHTPEVQAQFGIGPLTEKFNPDHCRRLYQALGKLLQTGSRVALRWPEAAAEKLLYTEQEQRELADPTAKVLDQYGNKFLQENQSVIALVLVFSAITQHKVQMAMQVLQAEREKAGAPGPTPRPTVINAPAVTRPIATGGA